VTLTRPPENVGENHDTRFERPFTLRLIAVGGGGAGRPKTFDFVKIRAKSLEIRAKSVEIWAKCLNTFAKSLYML